MIGLNKIKSRGPLSGGDNGGVLNIYLLTHLNHQTDLHYGRQTTETTGTFQYFTKKVGNVSSHGTLTSTLTNRTALFLVRRIIVFVLISYYLSADKAFYKTSMHHNNERNTDFLPMTNIVSCMARLDIVKILRRSLVTTSNHSLHMSPALLYNI
jgi:hypothetical protein